MIARRVSVLLSFVVAATACAPQPATPARPLPVPAPLPAASAAAPSPCDIAHLQRAKVPALLEQGKLDRAVRVIQGADALCPSQRAETGALLASTIAELQSGPEDGPTLIDAGLAARSRGSNAEAQRLLDRGVARLEKATGAQAVVEFRDGLQQPVSQTIWTNDKEITIVQGDLTTVLDASTLRERLREVKQGKAAAPQTGLSPDGTKLASAVGNAVRIRSVATGKEWLKLVGDKGDEINAVAFSPDGKRLAAATRSSIVVWDTATARQVGKISRDDRFFCYYASVAFSTDGSKVVSVEAEKQGGSATAPCWAIAAVYDLATRKQLSRFQSSSGTNVVSVAFSPDGGKVVSASVGDPGFDVHDKTLDVWDAATGQELIAIKQHTLPIDSVAVSPDGTALALSAFGSGACLQQKVYLWSGASGQGFTEFGGRAPVEFSPDGKKLQVGGCSLSAPGESALVDAATGRELARLHGDWHLFPSGRETERAWSAQLEPGKTARGVVLTRTSDKARLATLRLVADSTAGYLTTPEGYVDLIGDGARKVASCRVGQFSFPVDVCEERLVVPGLLGKVMMSVGPR